MDKLSKAAYVKAIERMKEQADLSAALREMRRVVNGYRAECIFFNRSQEIVEEKEAIYQTTMEALKTALPVLDAACYLRVRKNG